MSVINLVIHNLLSFLVIISLIVFIHEFGHFLVARLCGVKVDEFAIGFGKKLFSWRDKKGTQWKFCLLPLGGYVKMHGDRNAASIADPELVAKMSEEEKKISFVGKNVWQRMAIVSAGPIANFILAIFLFTVLFKINGINKVLPIIDEVLPNSAAYESGLKKGDEIIAIEEKKISEFDQIREYVILAKERELNFEIKRGEKILALKISPKIEVRKDFFGDEVKLATLGISAASVDHRNLNIIQSFGEASKETYKISIAVFKAVGELITGQRSVKELGGPIKIAKYSGKTVDMGIMVVLWFMAMISINLGVMNLLPVPVLDGGHLFFYAIEAVRRKALSQKTQMIGYRIGLSLVLSLMVFTTINDVVQLIAH